MVYNEVTSCTLSLLKLYACTKCKRNVFTNASSTCSFLEISDKLLPELIQMLIFACGCYKYTYCFCENGGNFEIRERKKMPILTIYMKRIINDITAGILESSTAEERTVLFLGD